MLLAVARASLTSGDMNGAQLSDLFLVQCSFGAVGEKQMFVTRANALSAASFMAGRFLITASTATESAFYDQVLECKSIKLEAAERSFKSV